MTTTRTEFWSAGVEHAMSMNKRVRERDAQRLRDHFAGIKADLFQPGMPADFAEFVLSRVAPDLAWSRVRSRRCVLCGNRLHTPESLRLSLGPECFEQHAGGAA